jgi:signal transduction histidine kinase
MRQDFEELKRGILDLLQPDFRNPLNSVSNYSQQLESSLKDAQTEEEMRDSLKGIQSASRNITKMVEDFIFLAEMRTGEAIGSFELQSRPTNASIILMEVCDLVRSEVVGKDVALRQKVDMSLPQALIDYDRLKSGVLRLIHLLIDYSAIHEGESVLVGSLTKDDFVHLVLGLEGTSFPEETVVKLAALFAQDGVKDLDISEHNPDLLITKGIINLHSGRIRIDNKPGRSTRFVISLPVYQPSFDYDPV